MEECQCSLFIPQRMSPSNLLICWWPLSPGRLLESFEKDTEKFPFTLNSGNPGILCHLVDVKTCQLLQMSLLWKKDPFKLGFIRGSFCESRTFKEMIMRMARQNMYKLISREQVLILTFSLTIRFLSKWGTMLRNPGAIKKCTNPASLVYLRGLLQIEGDSAHKHQCISERTGRQLSLRMAFVHLKHCLSCQKSGIPFFLVLNPKLLRPTLQIFLGGAQHVLKESSRRTSL